MVEILVRAHRMLFELPYLGGHSRGAQPIRWGVRLLVLPIVSPAECIGTRTRHGSSGERQQVPTS